MSLRATEVIANGLNKVPLSVGEKDFLSSAITYEKFRQITISIDAGGYFGVCQRREEPADAEWLFFWVYPCDPEVSGYHNIHYKLRANGDLDLVRDE